MLVGIGNIKNKKLNKIIMTEGERKIKQAMHCIVLLYI